MSTIVYCYADLLSMSVTSLLGAESVAVMGKECYYYPLRLEDPNQAMNRLSPHQ
ncbi:hypothetical protein [Psychrobacter immobilis]|uniref:hypothetical protein n=1 Tax=Psychrobacter immobilis TaxID=498 RepID=UPI001917B0BC|nr:hypothetical protein [Psychrobacter immobilis]